VGWLKGKLVEAMGIENNNGRDFKNMRESQTKSANLVVTPSGSLSCMRSGQKSGGDGASQSRRLPSIEQLLDHRPNMPK
jgi:hypothetical protein